VHSRALLVFELAQPGPTLHIQLLYVSRAVGPQTTTVTESILTSAQANNSKLGIGGVLCQGQGLYLQLLEGERSAVNRLYATLLLDTRHKQVELLHLQEVQKRRFASWSMAHVLLRADDAMVLMQHPEFDPYAATGALAMQLVDELVADGHRIQLPRAY
jgi:hypothetical protein